MQRPNIIFVFADQMRASAVGCAAIEGVSTPNLDRFVAEGTTFTRAIANHPVCCPSRATLLTGLHSLHHGLVVNDQQLRTDVKTIAHHLNDAGYRCGYVGKWHMDIPDRGAFIPPGPRRRGFDDLWAVNNCNHDYLNAYYYLNDNPEPVWIEGYEPDAQTDIAVDFISRNGPEQDPFCLFLSWGPPHCPYREVPRQYLEQYPADGIRLKPNAPEMADRDIIAGYYAHISALDQCFGRILAAVEAHGLAENTIVVFASDHGDMLFSQNKGWKMKPWNESVNIPLMARWPGNIPSGRRCGSPVGIVDIMPTLLGLAGLQASAGLDGKDLSQLFLGEDDSCAPAAQAIYSIIGYRGWSDGYGEWRGLVTASYTYARLMGGGWLLYHDAQDPYQMRNLIDDEDYRDVRNELEEQLQTWLREMDDPFYSSGEALDAYVRGKVIVSEDREALIANVKEEYGKVLRTMHPENAQDLTGSDMINDDRTVWFFDNLKIQRGRTGEGRALFHRDLFR